MTGLDPARHRIVEIATIITDDQLEVVAEGPDLVVHQPEEALADDGARSSSRCTPAAGCSTPIRASTMTLEDAGAQTLAFLREHLPEARTVPLCGNSIGTDRRFLAAYLPEIEEYLHYRSVDVSSIKELAKRWYPDLNRGRPHKQGSHRALDDIRESIEELRWYRERVFVARARPARCDDCHTHRSHPNRLTPAPPAVVAYRSAVPSVAVDEPMTGPRAGRAETGRNHDDTHDLRTAGSRSGYRRAPVRHPSWRPVARPDGS